MYLRYNKMNYLSIFKMNRNLHTIPLSHLSSPALDSKGFVKVIDCMPRAIANEAKNLMCDSAIVQAARVSYSEGLKDYEKDKKLILTCSACGKSETKSHSCKEELKGIELILKHLENNVWVIKKGLMVEQKDIFDPFTQTI